ncbi:MAG TPA: DUF6152 family protein [Gammaproteobacteria bacterium]|nr:DUF6152 family protein [Gammaproteobacteria bacterium]
MNIRILKLPAIAVLSSAIAAPAWAHHSFAAEFDVSRPIMLRGIVDRMEFSNPHSWIYVEVTTDSGEVQQWAIEGAAPNALLRRGFSRNSLPSGIEITVRGFQARDRTFRAAGRDVTLPDGSKLFVGSGGVGAPPGEEE